MSQVMNLLFYTVSQWLPLALATVPSSHVATSGHPCIATNLTKIMSIISYLPIAVYAESLRVNSAIAAAAMSDTTIPPPLTGCVKDFSRLWDLRPSDILSGSEHSLVASLRHGNQFPLVNKALLDLASITQRRQHPEDYEELWRPVIVNISYLTPITSNTQHARLRMLRFVVVGAEMTLVTACSGIMFFFGLYVGSSLLLCLMLNLALLSLFQCTTSPIFRRQQEVVRDAKIGTAGGAALDAHVVVEHWNATELDVVVGFSAHLHALTNMEVRVKRWQGGRWIVRALGLVLVAQAALLMSQVGSTDVQVCGSAAWLAAYLVLLAPARLLLRRCPDALLKGLPASAERLAPLIFSSRRAALAFVATLPMTEPKAGKWEWLNGFLPPDERRKVWEAEMDRVLPERNDEEVRKSVEGSSRSMLEEIERVWRDPGLVEATARFWKSVGKPMTHSEA